MSDEASGRARVCAIVVSHETRELLLGCLDALVASVPADELEIVVVDNASTDGSADAAAAVSGSRVVRNERNVGFGAACNQGIRLTRAPFLLLVNSDARVNADAYRRMRKTLAERPGCAAVGCRQVDATGAEVATAWRFLTPLNQPWERLGLPSLGLPSLRRSHVPRFDADGVDETPDWLEASCLLLRRDALDQLGDGAAFDERFFMYVEDEDLALRLRLAGWSLALCDGAPVEHLGGASAAQKPDGMRGAFYRSQLAFLCKHRGLVAATRFGRAMGAVLRLKSSFGPRALRETVERERSALREALGALPGR